VTELRAADLRFTLEEAATFLAYALGPGATLPAEAVAALEARSEGWVAGLQLAALSVQGRSRQEIETFFAAFTGSNRYIVDYLAEEVLARQSVALQDFLLRTAVVDRFCLPLVERLIADGAMATEDTPGVAPTATGQPEQPGQITATQRSLAQTLLEQADRANLFLIPLDDERRWHRYHHLFADALRSQLRRRDQDLYTEPHRRASAWCKEEGLIEEAVAYALNASDFACAAALLEGGAVEMVVRAGRFETGLGWLRALPKALVRARPLLSTLHAVLLLYTYQYDAVEDRLRDAEAALMSGPSAPPKVRAVASDGLSDEARTILGYIALIRSSLPRLTGDTARPVALAEQALELIPASDTTWRAALVGLATEYEVSGDVTPAAERRVVAAVEAARDAADLPVVTLAAIAILERVEAQQGRLRQVVTTFRDAERLVGLPLGLEEMVDSHVYAVSLGDALREWNELDAAERYLLRGVDERGGRLTLNASMLTQGYAALARLNAARGENARALATLDDLAEVARRRGFVPELVEWRAAVRAELALAIGNLPEAAQWAEASSLTADDMELPFPREPAYLALARVRIAQGRSEPGGPHFA
jgi:ATP/maltotriose-dependent transcriptional regulator MalT